MNSITRHVALVGGLVLLMHVTPSWGDVGSVYFDANNNAAAGQTLFNGTFTGSSNTGLGRAMFPNLTSGSLNTATGTSALAGNTTGSRNTASGMEALFVNTIGGNNTAIGVRALYGNTSGSRNTASGDNALTDNTTGGSNTANGNETLALNTTGNNNTASGARALEFNTIGNLNAALGFQALQDNNAGNNNTAVGAKALKKSLGTKNIAIGFQAGVSLINGNNNIYIGNQGAGDESQTVRIGTAQAQTFIAGIGTASVSGATVEVDTGTGQLGIVTSSARYKQDIAPMGNLSEKVLELRPVTFAYKDDARKVTHYGLVAEEVAAVYPDLVTRTATGDVQAVRYQELIPMLLNELQRLRQEVAELRAQGQGRGAAAETAAVTR